MGYVVVFSVNGLDLVVGYRAGLTKISADRMVEDLDRQGIVANIEENLWKQD